MSCRTRSRIFSAQALGLKKLFPPRESRGGRIPVQGRHDGKAGTPSPLRNRFTPACVL
ncbi:hypothetical protein AGR9A_Lc60158 [Agrobacterium salinitolerans str. Hayward 0363]|nr:hypothetical protein AGR9A_Lc60158 [Agrobacterium salinitolerans str. Hayward 0363]